jgi:UDP-galactopyranose mutase
MPVFDWLIVGAGFAGSVLAERLATQLGHRVLVIDKRPQIGGNAYDCYDATGVLIHQYGPHDHATVLSDGRSVTTLSRAELSEQAIMAAMAHEAS